ncbi:MAG: twin-arginine translocase TatA/TatE family subunit [Planctomycetaceae bacterium]|jgi:Sec-independent protein translocase protein TatA|nr:twin-arginine translocase TatA/TatE family subunit [Planctomycetaceae bacterium]
MSISPITVIAVLLLGVLLFGKNLPQAARQIGSALIEFRKGVNEWKEAAKREVLKEGENKKESVGAVLEEDYKPSGTKFVPPSE